MTNPKQNLSAAVLIAALALSGCATPGGSATTGAAAGHRASAETAAMAATYRYLFANNASSLQGQAATSCVAVGTGAALTDPTPELMAALAGEPGRTVQPVSTCTRGERALDAAGRPALIFNLSPVGCENETSCLFNGGYYEGNVSASGGNYRARLVDGAWQVQPDGPQAVS